MPAAPAAEERFCSNPFRIPQHRVSGNHLRNVPRLVRERLAHVSFGRRICNQCRKRVYAMLKQRNQLKPSTRLSRSAANETSRRRSEPGRTRSENGIVSVAADTPKSPSISSSLVQEASLPGPSIVSEADSNLADIPVTLSEHTMSRRSRPQAQLPSAQAESTPGKQICCFCGLTEDNELEYGKFYEHSGIVTHYYCLLLSSNMEQKGDDDEGILGFLADDIQKEIRRGRRLVCSYCKKNGATLGCCNTKCKKIFHFPCGLKAGSLHQFFGEFRSYCITHKPKQKIDERVKKEVQGTSNVLCYICYESVQALDPHGTLWAPCCKKNAWFHRNCVQQLAMSAGYFFKCPLCNNKREFQTAMLEYGIYIPRQDASWELVPNAFQELLYRHDRCDAKECLCPKGRKYTNSQPKWDLILCQLCGSQGTHVFCSQLKWTNPVWECNDCLAIIKKSPESAVTTEDSTTTSGSNLLDSTSNSSSNLTSNLTERNQTRESTTLNVTIRENEEDSDSDISVGNESLPAKVENSISQIPKDVKLKPGPRSFKLQQVKRLSAENNKESSSNSTTAANSINNSRESISATTEVICLDSDDEAVEILCESVMQRSANKRLPHFNSASSSSNSFNFPRKIVQNGFASLSNTMNGLDSSGAEEVAGFLPTTIEENNSSFNIIISNVQSVSPEDFANETEEVTQNELESYKLNQLKRNLPNDETDYDVSIEASKRVRLDIEEIQEEAAAALEESLRVVETAQTNTAMTLRKDSTKTILLSDLEQSPPNAPAGSNGTSSSSKSCHGDAGTSLVSICIRRNDDRDYTTINCPPAGIDSNEPSSIGTTYSDPGSAASTSQHDIHPILENGATSNCNGSSGSGDSSKSRSSSRDRTGLIPDTVNLRDLKFKICGNNLELIYGACKVQVKVNSMPSSATSDDAGNVFASVSSFAGSNQNLSSERSSKSQNLPSDDTSESSKSRKLSRTRNFVYEDDNTLLEYPTSTNNGSLTDNDKVLRKFLNTRAARVGRHEWLKENYNPYVSNSNNNTWNSSDNNNSIGTFMNKMNFNTFEKLNKNDYGFFPQPQTEQSSRHRLWRRNKVRYFRSVQQKNDQIDSWSDSDTDKSFPPVFEKINEIAVSNRSRSSRSQKSSNGLNNIEKDKHLKNVNFCEKKLKTNKACNYDQLDADFKISIDLQKIDNLLSAKPNLFLKTKTSSIKELYVYRVDEKLKVGFEDEKRNLKKSQSFDSLLELTKNNLWWSQNKNKSFDNFNPSYIDNNVDLLATDKKDCIERIERNQHINSIF